MTALAFCGVANAAKAPWVTLVDKPEGFELTVPKSVFLVPNSVAKVRSIINQLEAQKQSQIAHVYSTIINSTNVTLFVFEAFIYSPSASIQPTVTLAVGRTPAVNTVKDVATTAEAVARGYAAKGAKILDSKVVTLPAGLAAFVELSVATGASAALVEIYVVAHGRRLYELSFATDASTRSDATTFTAIARQFAFA